MALGAPTLLFLLLALRAAIESTSDPDGWWLAAAGRELLHTHHLPTRNGWSFADPEHPWVLHEGAVAALYAVGLEALGAAFFPLVGVLGASASVLLAGLSARASRPSTRTAVLLVVLVACRECLFSPRPGYALLGLPAAMALLSGSMSFSVGQCVLAVLLQALWVQSHGSFPLGLGLLALGVWEGRADRGLRLLALGLGASSALATPYGLALPMLVARYLTRSDPAMAVVQAHIAEFAPLWRAHAPFVNGYLALGALVALALAVSALRTPGERPRGVAVLALLALAVWHSRHLVLAVYLGMVLLPGTLERLFTQHAEGPAPERPAPTLRAVVVAALVAALVALGVGRGRPLEASVHRSLGGAELVRLARRIPAGARVFVPFEASGLVLWLRAGDGVRVLVDPRNDCYRAEVLTDAYGLQDGTLQGPRALSALARYGTEGALVPVGHPLHETLRASAWRVTARDGAWALYEAPALTGDRARRSAD